ncbi:MAG: hypothetical protein M1835_006652 [Candelina submexicana]|nr:MAG: hypothetical protein M1835_006652 [Candelina submexicana]
MSSLSHTYGPTCHFASQLDPPNEFMRRASLVSDIPPKIRAQFFYTSALPIDDPLSAVPLPTSGSGSTPSKHPPRPFSAYDNAALEEAWEGLEQSQKNQQGRWWQLKGGREEGGTRDPDERLATRSTGAKDAGSSTKDPNARRHSSHKSKGSNDVAEFSQGWGSETMKFWQQPKRNSTPGAGFGNDGQDENETRPQPRTQEDQSASKSKSMNISAAIAIDKGAIGNPIDDSQPPKLSGKGPPYGASPNEKATTGTPFLRAPIRKERSRSPARNSEGLVIMQSIDGSADEGTVSRPSSRSELGKMHFEPNLRSKTELNPRSRSQGSDLGPPEEYPQVIVPVGISRLHSVEMPEMLMKPIYWSPVHDISSVIRGTWFYKDSMLPVEADIANQLELGYLELKPWTQTWTDELNSAVEVGVEGESKVAHRLWPAETSTKPDSRPATARNLRTLTDMKAVDALQTAKASDISVHMAVGTTVTKNEPVRKYRTSSVFYTNARDAFILRPSLMPSAYYGRKPLTAARKGRSVGIPVVRGFDYQAWDKLHPVKKSTTTMKAQEGAAASQSGVADADLRKSCATCLAEERRPHATDLVLVIHGIGQKLSERVESYHFTHAINSFRRQVNVELGTDAVKHHLRKDFGGIMVLPINWRSTLSFEDGGPPPDGTDRERDPAKNEYSLGDITPETIPAVRNLISDVMLDIPYYLSHHKPKMIQAVVREANRVYRLWCKNNRGFDRKGRVHLIAHSLGSVMALDILSKQPTRLPMQINLESKLISDENFEFDTKGLFFCGSPAGFFLLLNRGNLLPRKDRDKAGADGEDIGKDVAGEAGPYGCLAVDNIYNVLNYTDPIAYRLNATVDVNYAASLKIATVPRASSSFFGSVGYALGLTSGVTATAGAAMTGDPQKPNMARLPSTIEMDTHNFTREEIAEKRFHLLNDNGQIDYFLSSGGGPLDIQYLNMLGAHSSYWILQDFVRFLVVEIGRNPGRENTLLSMRPVKKAYRK